MSEATFQMAQSIILLLIVLVLLIQQRESRRDVLKENGFSSPKQLLNKVSTTTKDDWKISELSFISGIEMKHPKLEVFFKVGDKKKNMNYDYWFGLRDTNQSIVYKNGAITKNEFSSLTTEEAENILFHMVKVYEDKREEKVVLNKLLSVQNEDFEVKNYPNQTVYLYQKNNLFIQINKQKDVEINVQYVDKNRNGFDNFKNILEGYYFGRHQVFHYNHYTLLEEDTEEIISAVKGVLLSLGIELKEQPSPVVPMGLDIPLEYKAYYEEMNQLLLHKDKLTLGELNTVLEHIPQKIGQALYREGYSEHESFVKGTLSEVQQRLNQLKSKVLVAQ